jgi:tetratricopeptide (TPR) repeat protein
MHWRLLPTIAVLLLARPGEPAFETPGFAKAIAAAEQALAQGNLDGARGAIQRALERDPKSARAWALEAARAEAAGERDELVYAKHRELRLRVAQKADRKQTAGLREALIALDPIAKDLLALNARFRDQLVPLAKDYEKQGRRHSAIRVYKELLALDPEDVESQAAIERIAAAPDPSLAEDAKPKDLLADVSEEWIAEHDAEHGTWDERAVLERENYVTMTDAGYEVLLRSAEAMEQMNAFYRAFFGYGAEGDKRAVSRIDLRIFKSRDEYLKLGEGPPVEWSGGHFTGGAVETYIGQGGFQETVGTLFHEAAHQFVSLATNAAGWLNEGLASFFEGCRILPNGTVLMNLPANQRLFPLVERMEKGWMSDAWDGMDRQDPSKSEPEEAPTFRIVLEDEYPWGPAWYAPTWGVAYFLYNYQDPVDGRFVYRKAFRTFVDESGGRMGAGAVENFEEVVLAHPAAPTPGVDAPEGEVIALPKTCAELDAVWKAWLVGLRDEQAGRSEPERRYHDWARHALTRGELDDAEEHFEKGLVATPDDAGLLSSFATLLAEKRKNPDRAAKLLRQAVRALEAAAPVDERLLSELDARLAKLDPKHRTLERLRDDLQKVVVNVARRYQDDGLDLMAMDVSWRFGNDLFMPALFATFEASARRAKKTLALWKLAYNETNLAGWSSAGLEGWQSEGERLSAALGTYTEGDFGYRFLTLDQVTSGDFSMDVELRAESGAITFAGLVFGQKSANDFHALLFYPPSKPSNGAAAGGKLGNGWIDLATFRGGGDFKTWRHNPVAPPQRTDESAAESWHRLRIDVTGALVDAWFDGQYVATQDFGAVDVLRGSFGLMIGSGMAQFRNVRYLARQARDPGAAIERAIRMEELPPSSRGGSWLGALPPFPKVQTWVQGSRSAWREGELGPVVLVLWSLDQNRDIPIDEWLVDLERKTREVGLAVVAVCSAYSGGRKLETSALTAYLQEHPFPGAVALDTPGGEEELGQTFGDYRISPTGFGLPRLLLLDVDGKVAWEGDPGFKIGRGWIREEASYLDAPLEDLVARRKLREVRAWIGRWCAGGAAALARGDLAMAWPLIVEARAFDRRLAGELDQADRARTALEAALAVPDESAVELAARQAEPALEALVHWGELCGSPVDPKAHKRVKAALASANSSAWKRALAMLAPLRKRIEAGKPPSSAADVRAKLAELPGALVRELEARLAAAEGDAPALASVVLGAEELPAAWLAREVFGWTAPPAEPSGVGSSR